MATGKSRTSQETYILLQDDATITNSTSAGKKASKFSLRPKKKEKNEARSTQYVPAGTLLRKDLQTGGQEVYVPLSGSKLEDCHLSYASSVVAKLSNEEYDLLALISSRTKRIEVYKDKAWMEEGLNLKPKDGVEIHGYSTIQDGTHAIVKSKRCWAGHSGVLFEIQLTEPKKIISVTIENIRKCQTHSPTGTHHSPKPGANLAGGGDDAFLDELKKKQKSIKPGQSGKMGMKSRSRSLENILGDDRPNPSSTLNRNLQAADQKHAAAPGLESPTKYPSTRTLAAQTGKPLKTPAVETKRQPLPLPSPKCAGGMGKKTLSKSMDSLLDDDLPTSPAQGGVQSSPSVENILDDECRKPSSTLNRNPHTAGQKHVTVRELESPTNNPLQRSRTLAAQTVNHQEKFPFTHSKPLNRLAATKSRKCTGGMGKKSLSKSMNSLLDDDLPTSPTGGGLPSDLHSSSVENAMDNDHLKPSCTSKRKFHKAAKKHAAIHELESSTNNLSQRSHGLAAQTENHQENIPFTNSKPLNQLAIRTERQPLPLPSPEGTGGMGKKSLSKSMDSLLDDRLKTSKSESPMIDRNPPEPKLFSSEKCPLGSSESHTSGRTWRRMSGPVEDDDRNYDPPSPTSKPRTTSDTPSQRYKLEPIDYDDEDDMATSPETHEPHYVNIDRSRAGETVEEETEPVYVNVPHPGQNQRKAAENEPIYANLPHPTQVTNGTHEVPPLEDHQEESSAIDDQVESAGAAASTVNNDDDDDDTYGLFSCQGFLTDHNAVFSQCEQRLLEEEHSYEAIQVSVNPEDIFDQTYPLDPNQQYTGTCAIIDQFTYDRKGTYIDVRTIYELFENLFKFRIDYQKNLSKKEFLAVFKKHHDYMANPANRVQRFVCFILGHGDEKGIMTCVDGLGSRFNVEEGARIDVNKDLLPFLSSCSLKTMAGKPKLFFIQACRGHAFQGGQGVQGEADPHDGIDQGGDPSPDETILLPHMSVPNDSDILVAYAQTAGNQAFRDMRSGSWFIQAVADIFRDYHERYDVLSMMTMVSNAVSYMSCHNPNGSEHKQSPTVQHTLRKKMFMLRASP